MSLIYFSSTKSEERDLLRRRIFSDVFCNLNNNKKNENIFYDIHSAELELSKENINQFSAPILDLSVSNWDFFGRYSFPFFISFPCLKSKILSKIHYSSIGSKVLLNAKIVSTIRNLYYWWIILFGELFFSIFRIFQNRYKSCDV